MAASFNFKASGFYNHNLLHLNILSSSWHYVCFWRAQVLTSWRPYGWGNKIFLFFHLTIQLKCHVTFWVWSPHRQLVPYQGLGAIGLVNVEIKRFWFVTRPCDQCVTWLCGWSSLILSHHPAQFGVHRPCESGDTMFFTCRITTILMFHVTLWLGSTHISHHPAKSAVHRPYATGNNGVCNISSNSYAGVYKWPLINRL